MDRSEEKFFEELAQRGKKDGKAPLKKTDEEDFVSEPEGQLTIDVYQTPNDIVVESAIAGVKPEDIDIDVNTDSVTIRGERRREHEVKEEDYFYQECYWGRFSRSVILPQEVDPEKASVNFKNGVLTVRLPKLSRSRSRKLKVKVE
jgi:HSP20 family protein